MPDHALTPASGPGKGGHELEQKIGQFCRSIAQRMDLDAVKKGAGQLYREVIAPFISESELKKISTLIIAGDGPLTALPFETLVTGDRGDSFKDLEWFFRKVRISYVPSASILRTIRRDQAGGRLDREKFPPILLFGDPLYSEEQIPASGLASESPAGLLNRGALANLSVYRSPEPQLRGESASDTLRGSHRGSLRGSLGDTFRGNLSGIFPPLPGSRKEVEQIAEEFYQQTDPEYAFLGKRAQESILKSLSAQRKLESYRFVHFATHGILPGEVQGLSEPALVLSLYGDPDNDGFLKMSEIFSLHFNAVLVTLSACQTGIEALPDNPRAEVIGNQGLSGLARAFFFAGTPRLLATLWNIDDEGTSAFMQRVYRKLKHQENQPPPTPFKNGPSDLHAGRSGTLIPEWHTSSGPLELSEAAGKTGEVRTSVVDALNSAREEMLLSSFDHPYFWGPFLLLGEPR